MGILSASRIFNGVSEEELFAHFNLLSPVEEEYSRGDVVVQEGDEERELGIVTEGTLKGEKFHLEGEVHLVSIFETGEILSLDTVVSRTKVAPLTITAATDCRLLAMDIEALYQVPFASRIKDNIISILADQNIQRLYKIDILSHNGLRSRILTYLQIMSNKHHGQPFHIMMNQEQFAHYLSVNRSALSNELNKMRKEGILYFERDKFILLKK